MSAVRFRPWPLTEKRANRDGSSPAHDFVIMERSGFGVSGSAMCVVEHGLPALVVTLAAGALTTQRGAGTLAAGALTAQRGSPSTVTNRGSVPYCIEEHAEALES